MGDKKVDIDENSKDELYNARSRDAAALGFDTIKRVGETSVLVVGLKGVGVEAAKNLILNGPKRVALFDPEVVAIADLGTNFYLKKEHVGTTTRAKASQTELQGLNSNCIVDVLEGKLSDDDIQQFDFVVVGSLLPQEELIRINEAARNRKPTRAAFVWAVTHGGVATLFSDFGAAHEISDPNGEPVREFVVQNVTSAGVVTVTAKRHGLDDGSKVKFAELEGSISKINGLEVTIREYKICGLIKGRDGVEKRSEKPNEIVPNKFVIDLKDSKIESLGDWTNGGVLQEVKPKRVVKYLSLKEALQKPADGPVPHMDAGLYFDGRGDQLLLATLAILRFQKEKGSLPALHSRADTKTVLGFANAINEEHKKLNAEKPGSALEVKEANEEIIAKVSKYVRTELSGYAAFLGGVAAQELVKLWGKYTPVSQWLTSDHFEMIQAEPPIDAIPQSSRYDHQINIFGKAFQQRLSNQKWFLVGVGALGCEYLKAYAVMGLGTGPKGSIHITDNDNIELSNLSRQFLFRRQHLGKPKSVCAAEVVAGMNPELKDKITVHNQKVEPASEKFFNDAFWDSLDGVWNALDNVQARQYTDSKCLLHSLPLLESGTQGTAGSTDVILPFKTASYQDGAVAETGAIPACTLKNFPNEIAHCIEWARPQFFELFDNEPADFNAFVQTPDKFFAQVDKSGHVKEKLDRLKKVKRLLEVTKERKYSTAIHLALERFDYEFRSRIKDLISFFPEDFRILDKQTGADLGAFWQGAKRFPRAAEFAESDELTFGYVYHTAQIFAHMLGVEPVADESKFREELKALNYKAPEWKAPTSGKPQEVEESDAAKPEEETDDDFKIVDDLIAELKAVDLKTVAPLKPSEFEKDDDKNHHVDFLTHCSNLRAWNYKIQPATRAKVKVTAGRIIPALATTTAATTGLMTLEFYKLLLGFQFWSQSKFRNAQIDFANSAFNYWEPGAMHLIQETKEVDPESKAVTITKAYPSTFSSWDKVVVRKGNLTIREFAEIFPSVHYGVKVDTLHLFGLTAKDIKEKKGKILYGHPKRSTAQYKSQLARKGISDGNKKKFEEMLKQAEEFNAKIDEQYGSKLIDVFVQEYGPLVSPDRNYVLLSGRFLPAAGDTVEDTTVYAKVPVIQYFFK